MKQYLEVEKIYLLRTLNPEDMLVYCIEVTSEHYKVILLALSPKPLDIPNPYGGYYLLKRRDRQNTAMFRKAKLVSKDELPLYISWPYVSKYFLEFFKR